MRVYEALKRFDDAVKGLKKLAGRYRLAALTNANQWLLDQLSENNIPVARACGFRGAYVNRSKLTYEDSPLRPDLTVQDFLELSRRLAAKRR